ncbi:MAG: FUSC family protein [Ornithinimicrobium sp.]
MIRLHGQPIRVVPPAAALALAAALLAAVLVAAGVIAWVAGAGVTLAFGMGVVGGVPAATSEATLAVRVLTGLLLAAGALGGSLTSSSPWESAALVIVLALAQGRLTVNASGIAVFAPVIAAVFASVDVIGHPALIALGVILGYAFVQLLSVVMRLPRRASAVEPRMAWLHAAVFAVLAGPAVLVTRSLEVGHGYWLLLTLAVVLQPAPGVARAVALARMAGTVSGVVVAIVMVAVLPAPLLVLAAAACLLLSVGWGISADVGRSAHYGVLAILFLGSGGSLATGVDLGIERLVLTGAAVVLAIAASAVLERIERSS